MSMRIDDHFNVKGLMQEILVYRYKLLLLYVVIGTLRIGNLYGYLVSTLGESLGTRLVTSVSCTEVLYSDTTDAHQLPIGGSFSVSSRQKTWHTPGHFSKEHNMIETTPLKQSNTANTKVPISDRYN